MHIKEDVAYNVGLNVPMGQRNNIPAMQYIPIGHALHSCNPVDNCFEYVPSGHCFGFVDPSRQNDPGGHVMQLADKSRTTNSLSESKLVPTETFPYKG